jgi:hypothetical protein
MISNREKFCWRAEMFPAREGKRAAEGCSPERKDGVGALIVVTDPRTTDL